MKYKELKALNQIILSTKEPECQNLSPVVNMLLPTQKYLIISSDPSSDTDKTKNPLEKHSGFEERVLALMFYGTDDAQTVAKIRHHYKEYKEIFFNNFYWTHFSKIYASGKPNSFWADKFLIKEIKLFEPKCIIIFGNIVTEFLFGRGKFIDKINKVLLWNNIPTVCCLHPSKDWNMFRREKYCFDATWKLIRQKCYLNPKEEVRELKQKARGLA